MAGNTDYFPKQDAALSFWCENYRKTLPDFAALFDLTPQEIADQQQWCDEIMQKITDVRAAKRQLKVLIESKEGLKKKNMEKLRKSVRQLKANDNYDTMTGTKLGVLGGRKYMPDKVLFKPKTKITVAGSYVRIDYKKKGVDGMEIFREIPGHEDWRSIGTDYHSPFIDNEPEKIKGVPEIRRYRVIALVNDKHFGTWSEVTEVVVKLSV
ncbi:MAG: hypothetical protein AB7G44_08575 [Bacteroidia bacterium]